MIKRYLLNVLLLLAIYIPFEGIVLRLIDAPWELVLRFGVDGTLGMVFVLAFLSQAAQKTPKQIFSPFIPFLLAVFLGGTYVLSGFHNDVPWVTLFFGMRQPLRYILVFLSVLYLQPAQPWIRRLLFVFVALALLQAGIGFLQVLTQGEFDVLLLPDARFAFFEHTVDVGTHQFWVHGTRIFGTLGRYDRFGLFLLFPMLFLTARLITHSNNRLLCAILLFVLAFALVFTFSRTAWVSYIAGGIALCLAARKWKQVLLGVGISLAFFVGYMSVYVSVNHLKISRITEHYAIGLHERILQTFSRSEWEISKERFGRIFFLDATLSRIVPDNFFLGVGPGKYGSGGVVFLNQTDVYTRYGLPFGVEGIYGQIDNNWFSMWGEIGTIGLVFFLLLIIYLYVITVRLYHASSAHMRALALGFFGLCAAWTVAGFLGPYFEVRSFAYYFWLIAGIVVAKSRECAFVQSEKVAHLRARRRSVIAL